MRAMGMNATGIAVLHRESGKQFGLCHAHENALGDAVVVIGPVFEQFTCIVCNHLERQP